MDNQHRLIKGYRELDEAEIAAMNSIKLLGEEQIKPLIFLLRSNPACDQRWISIGVTHLQEGLMALTRGVTKPEFF